MSDLHAFVIANEINRKSITLISKIGSLISILQNNPEELEKEITNLYNLACANRDESSKMINNYVEAKRSNKTN